MAYDEELASRIELILEGKPNIVAKKMFGGIGYLLNGNMACGVHKDLLVVRVGPDTYEEALSEPHTTIFDVSGRPMKGWIMVEPEGLTSQELLSSWVNRGLLFALTLPQK
jgi:TfoX/Sxy family transcriptional regulator of competence genes